MRRTFRFRESENFICFNSFLCLSLKRLSCSALVPRKKPASVMSFWTSSGHECDRSKRERRRRRGSGRVVGEKREKRKRLLFTQNMDGCREERQGSSLQHRCAQSSVLFFPFKPFNILTVKRL